MIDITRILCPIDFSEFSRHALDQALALARWRHATVTALHVFSVPLTVGVAAVDGSAPPLDRSALAARCRAESEAELERFVTSADTAGVAVDRVVTDGPTVDAILREAAARAVQLIVVGTHGRSGFERLMLGSVAERVLRKAPCPVLTVPLRAPHRATTFKRILCAVDFSPPSADALRYALSLAQEADASLIVANVIEIFAAADSAEYKLLNLPACREAVEEAARAQLALAIPESARTYCDIEEVILPGKPYRVILLLADEREVDLIVLGIHGRSAAELMLFGSTAQHVVRHAACPVLSIRPAALPHGGVRDAA